MPQLVKGGKWVFGWVVVGAKYQIQIPTEAYTEYGFQPGETVIITRGSRRSGGFGIGRRETLSTAKISLQARFLAQARMSADGQVTLPPEAGVEPGTCLLAARGSGLALGFLQRGPIYEEALKHPEIETFEIIYYQVMRLSSNRKPEGTLACYPQDRITQLPVYGMIEILTRCHVTLYSSKGIMTMAQDLWNTLDVFRKNHPAKSVMWNEKPYTYVVGGEGGRVIFLLPGGLGIGEPFFLHVLELEKEFKVIAPSYPDVASLDELAAGMQHIAVIEGAACYSVVGQSAGGLVAQILMRKFPDHVDKVVLAHTSTATVDMSEVEIAARVAGMKKRLRLLQLVPFFIIKRQLMRSINTIVETIHSEELYFWKGYFEYIFSIRTKREQVAMTKMLIDFATHYRFTPSDLNGWPGKVMILDSDSDTSIPQLEREAVRRCYSSAEIHTLEGLGHLALLSERETYLHLIREFLKRE